MAESQHGALLDEERVLEVKAQLEDLRKGYDPTRELHPETARRVFATRPLDGHLPHYFEIHGIPRGKAYEHEEPGATVHEYDAHGRLVRLLEPTGSRGDQRREWSAFQLPGDPGWYHRLDQVRRGHRRFMRLGRTWESSPGVWSDVSIDGHGQALAYSWKELRGRVTLVEVWDTAWREPERYEVDPRDIGLIPVRRAGTQEADPVPGQVRSENVSTEILGLVEAAMATEQEEIFALTLVMEEMTTDHIPPQIGVVYRKNVHAFLANPKRFDHDLGVVWNPLQAEDADLPVVAPYPYVDITSPLADELGPWPEAAAERIAAVEGFIRRLAKQLNESLDHQRWFFHVIDVSSYDWGRYSADLPKWARDELARARLLEPDP